METMNYRRTPNELRNSSVMFWTPELSELADRMSTIPHLIKTQDQFISIIGTGATSLDALLQIVRLSGMPANLFVKHLMVLTDFGGEMVQRINKEFGTLFPSGQLLYLWQGKQNAYQFQALPISASLTNDRLGVSAKRLSELLDFDEPLVDITALLIFGGAAQNPYTAHILEKCEISTFLGRPTELREYVKQRYIWVSRITSGEHTNALGQAAQTYVRQYLETHLGIDKVKYSHGRLPGVTQTTSESERDAISFDIILKYHNRYVAIEVSFQVTTNSVIERKSGQARNRYEQIDKLGYRIAYVIDGAGNFQRDRAIRNICDFSHCTVAFSDSELDVLCDFIRNYFLSDGD